MRCPIEPALSQIATPGPNGLSSCAADCEWLRVDTTISWAALPGRQFLFCLETALRRKCLERRKAANQPQQLAALLTEVQGFRSAPGVKGELVLTIADRLSATARRRILDKSLATAWQRLRFSVQSDVSSRVVDQVEDFVVNKGFNHSGSLGISGHNFTSTDRSSTSKHLFLNIPFESSVLSLNTT